MNRDGAARMTDATARKDMIMKTAEEAAHTAGLEASNSAYHAAMARLSDEALEPVRKIARQEADAAYERAYQESLQGPQPPQPQRRHRGATMAHGVGEQFGE